MSNLAIITARGGSKRIPRKNIKEFCGKPIIAYSIQAALESKLFEEVMVSTDDEEIAAISREIGAKVPFYRSTATSSDYATTMDVLREVINVYNGKGKTFKYMCCIYPTAPFVTAEKLHRGYDILVSTGADRVDTVVKYDCPPQWALSIDEYGFVSFSYPEKVSIRSQDLTPMYHDAGQFYWYNVDRCFYTGDNIARINSLILDPQEVQDIDDESDWKLAEMKFSMMRKL